MNTSLWDDLDAFFLEHRGCGEVDIETVTLAGRQEVLVGACSCGARFGQRLAAIGPSPEGGRANCALAR